jgi:hypothetical protein
VLFKVGQDFGNFGKVTAFHETENVTGREATRPGRVTDYLKYETGFSKGLRFTTEQARTRLADGGYENLQGYKASWQMTKRFGLSIEQLFVNREGEKPDQEATNIGVSYDFGKNLKVGYTFKKNIDTVLGGRYDTRWEITPGSFGGFDVGGSYYEGGILGAPSNSLGNFSISNPKPFAFGFLRDIKLKVGYDSETQSGVWRKENKLADLSAKVFASEIGFGYSRVMLPAGQFAEDRGIRYRLDPTQKKPFQLDVYLKSRHMPDGRIINIRDFDLSYKLGDKFVLSHTTDNFPEKQQGNAPLGTVVDPTYKRSWVLKYFMNPNAEFKFAFEDLSNIEQSTLARRTDVTLTLFAKSGSPLRLSYGVEQNEKPTDGRRTRQQYKFGFDQKPGKNQKLSFEVGTVDWADVLPQGELKHRFLLNIDYQLRF